MVGIVEWEHSRVVRVENVLDGALLIVIDMFCTRASVT